MPAFLSLRHDLPSGKISILSGLHQRGGQTLILPYFAITLTALAICTIRPYYHRAISEYGWKHILKWIFYYGQPDRDLHRPVVVLPALFFSGLYALVWLRIFDQKHIVTRCYALTVLILAGTYIRLADPLIPVMERLPGNWILPLCAAVFLIAGYYTNRTKLLEK